MRGVLTIIGGFVVAKAAIGIIGAPALVIPAAAAGYAWVRSGPMRRALARNGHYRSTGRWWDVEVKRVVEEDGKMVYKVNAEQVPASPAARDSRPQKCMNQFWKGVEDAARAPPPPPKMQKRKVRDRVHEDDEDHHEHD